MKTWKILPARPEDIPAIAEDMREADRREVWASHRHTPIQALENSLVRAEMAWTCLIEGVPAFMWGVCRMGSLLTLRGSPWLLGTNLFFRAHKALHREFLRQCPDYVARMQERFPRLENYIHSKNRLSIRWLKWCGFTLDNMPVPINGEDFFLFWRDAHV